MREDAHAAFVKEAAGFTLAVFYFKTEPARDWSTFSPPQ